MHSKAFKGIWIYTLAFIISATNLGTVKWVYYSWPCTKICLLGVRDFQNLVHLVDKFSYTVNDIDCMWMQLIVNDCRWLQSTGRIFLYFLRVRVHACSCMLMRVHACPWVSGSVRWVFFVCGWLLLLMFTMQIHVKKKEYFREELDNQPIIWFSGQAQYIHFFANMPKQTSNPTKDCSN